LIVQTTMADARMLTMKTSSRSMSSNPSRKWFRDMLIVAEVALAFVLLVASGLMIRSGTSAIGCW
jgi:hypothetical protein